MTALLLQLLYVQLRLTRRVALIPLVLTPHCLQNNIYTSGLSNLSKTKLLLQSQVVAQRCADDKLDYLYTFHLDNVDHELRKILSTRLTNPRSARLLNHYCSNVACHPNAFNARLC